MKAVRPNVKRALDVMYCVLYFCLQHVLETFVAPINVRQRLSECQLKGETEDKK
jgi:hypothetical protein